MRGLSNKIERICRAIAPDLAGQAFYCVLPSDLEKGLRPNRDAMALGCGAEGFDLLAQASLERSRRWRGRGRAIFVNPGAIARARWSGWSPYHTDVGYEILAIGVGIHELAHTLRDPFTNSTIATGSVKEFNGVGYLLQVGPDALGLTRPMGTLLSGHDHRFIRAALHLADRAAALGVIANDLAVIDLPKYGLSSNLFYEDALADDFRRCPVMMPISDVLAFDPPLAFMQLWWADIQRCARKRGLEGLLATIPVAGSNDVDPLGENDANRDDG